ncbi:MAG: DUF2911 domain-containing protein [Rhodothermales bacterium]
MVLRYALLLAPALILNLACEPTTEPVQDPNSGAFLTRLGNDTLVVEQFVRTPNGLEADVVIRTPTTTVRHYVIEHEPDGSLRRFEATVHDPNAPADAPPVRTDVATLEGDSLLLVTTQGEESRSRKIAGHAQMLPFLDMLHWPFELMLTRAYASGQDSITQDLFTGRSSMPFVIRRVSDSEMTVTHPTRGTMTVQVDGKGRLLHLDAGATTRKLTVERQPSIDLDALAQTFAARDAAGRPFGPLSARGKAEASVHGTAITVDYGTPSKRGRDIFGALVPWNERWRTGANRATHFETDRDLRMGDLVVPAGQYTLYTIPEPSGGTLIINRQTGQGGRTYNEDRDLGRVPMILSTLPETVEVFSILVEESGDGGVLKLQWDRTEFSVPFSLQ